MLSVRLILNKVSSIPLGLLLPDLDLVSGSHNTHARGGSLAAHLRAITVEQLIKEPARSLVEYLHWHVSMRTWFVEGPKLFP